MDPVILQFLIPSQRPTCRDLARLYYLGLDVWMDGFEQFLISLLVFFELWPCG
jgi:hypothetical protein